MSIYAIFNNLPALLVVVPLLLSPIAALIPIGRLAWVVALFGSGVSVIVAILLCSVTAAVSASPISWATGRRHGGSSLLSIARQA